MANKTSLPGVAAYLARTGIVKTTIGQATYPKIKGFNVNGGSSLVTRVAASNTQKRVRK